MVLLYTMCMIVALAWHAECPLRIGFYFLIFLLLVEFLGIIIVRMTLPDACVAILPLAAPSPCASPSHVVLSPAPPIHSLCTPPCHASPC